MSLPVNALSMSRRDFDNADVANAQNPNNNVYYHGPIPNHNSDWVPSARQADPCEHISSAPPPPSLNY